MEAIATRVSSRLSRSAVVSVSRNIWRYRSLLRTLTSRELKARYRHSALGYVWSLVNPLLMLTVYTFVFGTIFNPHDESVDPYALFLIIGLFPWIWIQTSWLEGTGSLIANAGLIRKATFPAEILPIVPVLSNLVHFALSLPVIAAAFLAFRAFGHPAGGPTAILLPVVTVLLLPALGGLALAFAALNAHFKDVRDLLTNLLTILFFGTPILYTLDHLDRFPTIQRLIEANPMTPFVLAFQQAVFFGVLPAPELWLEMAAWSAFFWIAGTWLFGRLSETVVEAV